MPRSQTPEVDPSLRALRFYQFLLVNPERNYVQDIARRLSMSPQAVGRCIDVVKRHLGDDALEIGREEEYPRRQYIRLKTPIDAQTLGLSSEEIHFLALGRELARQYVPDPQVSERIGQVLQTLSLQIAEMAGRQVSGAVGFRSKGSVDYSTHLPKISALRHAIDRQEVCHIQYRTPSTREEKLFRYAPGTMIAMNGALYVQGYRMEMGSLLKYQPMTLAVHRMISVDLQQEYFRFNAADIEARSFGLVWHEPRRMTVWVDAKAADYVRERFWSEDQSIDNQPDGSLLLTVSTTSEPELKAWVWSFGGLARLLTPAEGEAD
jgi:predicted DNA-binding transcriptional regulator YafY